MKLAFDSGETLLKKQKMPVTSIFSISYCYGKHMQMTNFYDKKTEISPSQLRNTSIVENGENADNQHFLHCLFVLKASFSGLLKLRIELWGV